MSYRFCHALSARRRFFSGAPSASHRPYESHRSYGGPCTVLRRATQVARERAPCPSRWPVGVGEGASFGFGLGLSAGVAEGAGAASGTSAGSGVGEGTGDVAFAGDGDGDGFETISFRRFRI